MVLRLTLACCAILFFAATAPAQSSVYVGGSVFAEMKIFGETEISGLPDIEDNGLDGNSAGGGLRVGAFLHPRWSLELAADKAAETGGASPYYYPYFASLSSIRAPDFNQSISFLTVSPILGYHQTPIGRFRPGYFVGLSFVTSTFKSRYPIYYILATQALPSGAPTILPPPGATAQTVKTTQNSAGVLVGFETAIDFGSHLSVVPEI